MNTINIAFIGAESAGKTTLLNSLFARTYGQTSEGKTTKHPYIYEESDNPESQKNVIRQNRYDNKLKENPDRTYQISKLYDLVDIKSTITVHDIPGINIDNNNHPEYESIRHINDNFVNFDVVMFVIDKFKGMDTQNKNILCMILENITNKINTNKANTQLICIVNKCDSLFMKNDKLVLDMDEEALFNNTRKVIDNLITENENYKHIDYQTIAMTGINAYVYRIYKHNPNNKLGQKYLDVLGYNEFGKSHWLGLSDNDKHKNIKKIIKKIDFDYSIRCSGFTQISDILNDYLTYDREFIILTQHIKLDMEKKRGKDICDRIEYLGGINSLVLELCDNFDKIDDNIKNEFKEEFNRTVNNEIDIFIQNNIGNGDIYKNNYISNAFSKIKQIFPELYENIIDTHKSIMKNIIDYYLDNITDKTRDINDLLPSLEKLYENGYDICTINFSDIFKNNENILKYTSDDFVNILLKLVTEYHISEDIIIKVASDILFMIYKNIYNNNDIVYTKNIDIPSYVFLTNDYWNRTFVPIDQIDPTATTDTTNKHNDYNAIIMQARFLANKNNIKLINSNSNSTDPTFEKLKFEKLGLENFITDLMFKKNISFNNYAKFNEAA